MERSPWVEGDGPGRCPEGQNESPLCRYKVSAEKKKKKLFSCYYRPKFLPGIREVSGVVFVFQGKVGILCL